jgi:hypothetical protein
MNLYRCPGCRGAGALSKPMGWGLSMEKCQPCGGSGVVWKVAEGPVVQVGGSR